MSSSVPLQIAETIQTASINRHPSPNHDLNPTTAASEKLPVFLEKYPEDEFGLDEDAEDEEEIPYSVIKPVPRRMSFGPLPDLRFEQSYLASIAGAETRWKVTWITIRDQVLMPLVQGTVWSLAIHGWRHWNRTAHMSGNSVGAKVRRWWYRTNNWPLTGSLRNFGRDAKQAGEVGDYYQNKSSNA